MEINVWYLYHSGFAVEIDNSIFIFDYYKDKCNGKPCLSNGVVALGELKNKDNIYLFASHRHHDHFNDVILSWKEKLPQVQYFLSSDIPKKYQKDWVHIIKPNNSYEFEKLLIKSFKSTDEGVAFLVDYKGLIIYHAGDLNWWHWPGEPKSWNNNMEAMYKKEISLISEHTIDIAFLPADPRQEEAELWGITYFLENVNVKTAFPMHFWDDYSIMDRVKASSKVNPALSKVHFIHTPGQHFQLQL